MCMLVRCQQHYSPAFWDTSIASPGSFPSVETYSLHPLNSQKMKVMHTVMEMRSSRVKRSLSCGIHPRLLFKWSVMWLNMGPNQSGHHLTQLLLYQIYINVDCFIIMNMFFKCEPFDLPRCTVCETLFKLWENMSRAEHSMSPRFTLHQH